MSLEIALEGHCSSIFCSALYEPSLSYGIQWTNQRDSPLVSGAAASSPAVPAALRNGLVVVFKAPHNSGISKKFIVPDINASPTRPTLFCGYLTEFLVCVLSALQPTSTIRVAKRFVLHL